MRKLLIIFCLMPSVINAMQFDKKNLQVPSRLGNISVFKTNDGFEIEESDSRRVEVSAHRVNKELRRMNMRQLAKFTKMGYIAVNQTDNGEYSLESHGRIAGGGPILASTFYWGTKVICWSAVAGATIFAAKSAVQSSDPGYATRVGAGIAEAKAGEKFTEFLINQSENAFSSGNLSPNAISNLAMVTTIAVAESETASTAVADVAVSTIGSNPGGAVTATVAAGAGINSLIEGLAGAAYCVGAWIPWI